jgi:ribose transport system permease protein
VNGNPLQRTARRILASPNKWVWLATITLYLVMLALTPAAATGIAMVNMLPFAGMLAVATLGQVLVSAQRGFDFSLAGIVAVASVASALLSNATGSVPLAMLLTVVVCAVCGLVNGVLIAELRLSPLIATLASNGLYLGVAYLLTGGSQVVPLAALAEFSRGRILGVATSAWIALVTVVVLVVLIRTTAFGRRFIAVGSNPDAAHAAGIRVPVGLYSAYTLAGACFGVTGVLITGFVNLGSVSASGNYLMLSISALMVAGGAAGGLRVSFVAAIVGAIFISMLDQFVRALGASDPVQSLIQGLVLIAAVALPSIRIRRRRSTPTPSPAKKAEIAR